MNGRKVAIAFAAITFGGSVLLILWVLMVPSRDRVGKSPGYSGVPVIIASAIVPIGKVQDKLLPNTSEGAKTEALHTEGELYQLLQSDDPQSRRRAVLEIQSFSVRQPDVFTGVLPKLFEPLLGAKYYAETIAFARKAIALRPQTSQLVAGAQRAIVEALLDEGQFDQALLGAKSYYNVATFKETAAAVDLVADVLSKSYSKQDSTIGMRFKIEQASLASHSAEPPNGPNDSSLEGDVPFGSRSILGLIKLDDAVYEPAILKALSQKESYGSLMGRGNLLLLADRPVEAKQCFISACRFSGTETGKLRNALEGVARAIRAQSGCIADANAFVLAIQQGDVSALPQSVIALGIDQLQPAAEKIALAALPSAVRPPPLESQRLEMENVATSGDQSVQISSGFESGTPFDIKRDSSMHFELTMTEPQLRDWFLFQARGVKGKTIRFDIIDPRTRLDKWWSLNPVFAYGGDITSPELYNSGTNDHAPATSAWNGSSLPSDRNQKWHWISQAWMSGANTFSFVQSFGADSAYIAMRPPHPPTYSERYIRGLVGNSLAKVIEVGRSYEDKPLLLVKIPSGGDQADRSRPCILLYAGEHADEQDAMWVAQGVIEYLLSNDVDAARLRSRFIFLIIPVLDPDASARGTHEGMIASFLMGRRTPESDAYANWFQSWIEAGNRLDLVFDLHNVQASESPDVECALIEGLGVRGAASTTLHAWLVKSLEKSRFSVLARPVMRGWSPDRLGGWLSRYYGALTLAYEVNSQSVAHHLSLTQLKSLGPIFVTTAAKFLSGRDASDLLANIDARRQQRLSQWAKFGSQPNGEDAIESEARRSGNEGANSDNLIEN